MPYCTEAKKPGAESEPCEGSRQLDMYVTSASTSMPRLASLPRVCTNSLARDQMTEARP